MLTVMMLYLAEMLIVMLAMVDLLPFGHATDNNGHGYDDEYDENDYGYGDEDDYGYDDEYDHGYDEYDAGYASAGSY